MFINIKKVEHHTKERNRTKQNQKL